jgi:predicted site-specific integrase-resolvase
MYKDMRGYYSIKDAANKLGVNAETLRRWDKAGKLKATRLTNNSTWYSIEAIDKIVHEGFDGDEPKRFPASIIQIR